MPKGTLDLDFGAWPGLPETSVAVTGQTAISGSALVEAWLVPVATTDHSEDEHIIAAPELKIIAGPVTAGVGFSIFGLYTPVLQEPLGAPSPSTFRSVAGAVYGYTEPSVGGLGINATGKYKVAWAWQN